MKTMKWALLPVLSSLLLVACGDDKTPNKPEVPKSVSTTTVPAGQPIVLKTPKVADKPLVQAATLNTQLPKETLAYIRIPSIWGLLANADGKALELAMNNQANVEQLRKLREALSKNLVSQLNAPAELMPWVDLLSTHAQSPLELVVIKDASAPDAFFIVGSLALDLKDVEAVNQLLSSVFATQSFPFTPQQADQDAQLNLPTGQIISFSFDNQTQQLNFAFNSTQPNPPVPVKQLFSQLKASPELGMAQIESEIDRSGQGLFAWINTALLATNNRLLPPPAILMMNGAGLNQAKQIAFGEGSVNGNGKFSLLIDMPNSGFRQYIPVASNQFAFNSFGKIASAFVLSIPRLMDLQRFEQMAAMSSEDKLQKYRESLTEFQQTVGVSLYSLIDAFGPELTVLTDQIGTYAAVKINQPDVIDTAIKKLQADNHLSYTEKTMGQQTIYHMTIAPTAWGDKIEPEERIMSQFFTPNLYWVKEGDYWIIASTPQMLMERTQIAHKQLVSDWLKDQQKVDLSHALLAGTLSVEQLPRTYYNRYIALLDSLSKLLNANIDVYSLPTATELNLPDKGAFSIQIDSSDNRLGLSLTYQNTPYDGLMQSPMGAVMVIGILSSISIPAYHDYMARAKVFEAVMKVKQLMSDVESFQTANNRFPTEDEISDMLTPSPDYTITLDGQTMTISLFFNVNPLNGDSIEFQLENQNQQGDWLCANTTVPAKYLPASLRDQCQSQTTEYNFDY